MRKKTSLLISSMLVLTLLFAGTACSSDHRNTGSDTQNNQSAETGLSSQNEASTSDTEASGTMLSGDATVSDKGADASDMDAAVSDKVADASDMVEAVDVVDPGMVPAHPDDLFEGLYPVKMRSSSSMFKADHVCLEVKDGHMQAYLFMSSQSYLYMFPGTAMDAANAEEGQYISLMKTSIEGEELEAFLLPVSALDEGLPFSSYSRRKEKWYDRTLLFEADSLPAEAFRTPRYKQLSDLNLTDGEYVIDVKLDGGSGRASVESPAKLTVSGGKATAHIVWSSNNYDFMIVDGEKYMPVNDSSGNSAFDMPVAAFDRKLPVQADTTAMSQPHLIDYTLTFDSSSIAKVS